MNTKKRANYYCLSRSIGLIATFAFFIVLFAACGSKKSEQEYLADAKQAVEMKKYTEGVIALKNALQINAANHDARVELSRLLLELDDYVSAEEHLKKLPPERLTDGNITLLLMTSWLYQGKHKDLINQKIDEKALDASSNAKFHALRALSMVFTGDANGAESEIAQGRRFEEDNLLLQRAQAIAVFVKGDVAKALKTVEKILSKDPEDIETLFLRANIQESLNQAGPAEETLKKVADVSSAQTRTSRVLMAKTALVRVYLANGKLADAKPVIEELFNQSPKNPVVNYYRAYLDFYNKDFDGAKERVNQALASNDRYVPALILAGMIYSASQDNATAENFFKKALALQPGNRQLAQLTGATQLSQNKASDAVETLKSSQGSIDLPTKRLLGIAYLRQGNEELGIKYLSEILESNSSDLGAKKELAKGYLQSNDSAKAIKLLEDVLDSSSNEFEARYLLLTTYLKNNNRTRAGELISELEKTAPGAWQTSYLRGIFTLAGQDKNEAAKHFKKAIDIDKNTIPARSALAKIAESDKRIDDAEKIYKEIVAINSKQSDALFSLARLSMAKKNGEEAVNYLKKVREADATHVPARLMLANERLSAGDMAQATEIAKEIEKVDPSNAGLSLLKGEMFVRQGKMAEARDAYKKAASTNEQNLGLQFVAARGMLTSGETDKARSIFESILKKQKNHYGALRALSAIDLQKGNYDSATSYANTVASAYADTGIGEMMLADIALRKKDLAKAIGLLDQSLAKRQSAEAISKKSGALFASGDFQKAVVTLTSWLEAHPADLAMRFQLAQLFQSNRQWKESSTQYEAIIKAKADHVMSLNNLAWIYMKVNNPSAEATAKRAFDAAPNVPAVADTYGWVLANSGKHEQALEILKKALNGIPNSPDIAYHVAWVQNKLGNNKEAKRLLTKIMESKVDFEEKSDAEKLFKSI